MRLHGFDQVNIAQVDNGGLKLDPTRARSTARNSSHSVTTPRIRAGKPALSENDSGKQRHACRTPSGRKRQHAPAACSFEGK
jgi:hypothetical protein